MPKPRTVSCIPLRFLDCQCYLSLSPEADSLLGRLYMTCDRHGRFPADPVALALHAKLLRPAETIGSSLAELCEARKPFAFTWVWADGNSYGELVGYDDDMDPVGGTRKRGESRYTHPRDLCPGKPSSCPGKAVFCPGKRPSCPGNKGSCPVMGGEVVPPVPGHARANRPDARANDPLARAKVDRARARESESEGEGGSIRPPPDSQTESRAHAREAIEAVLAEYQDRINGGGAKTQGAGRHSPGFFGTNSPDEVRKQLEELFGRHEGLAIVVCNNIWPFVDGKGGLGRIRGGMSGAIGECAKKHGLPSILAQLSVPDMGV